MCFAAVPENAVPENSAAIQEVRCFKEGMAMSRDHDLDELSDVRIPGELLCRLSQTMSEVEARIRRQACRRAVVKSGIHNCILDQVDVAESIQDAFRDGPSDWLQAFAPNESSHVRRAS